MRCAHLHLQTLRRQYWEKYKKEFADDEEPEKKITPLTDEDIQVLKTYGAAPYAAALKRLEKQIKEKQTSVNEKIGLSLVLFLPCTKDHIY